jgi:streptogramin lyase/PKD repeat protein
MSTHIQGGMRAIALCLMNAAALVGCGGGGGGGSGDATVSRTGVLVAQPLSLSATAVAPGHDVIMTASCSAGGEALRYQWDVGDGSAPISSTSAVFSHAYDKEGAYLPRVTCIDASGGATVSTASAYLRVTVPMHTVGAITVTPGSGNQVAASATCTGTTGRSVTFTWDFGDGQSSSQTVETPKASVQGPSGALSFAGSHTYGATGQYTVTGRCIDNQTTPDLAQNAVAAPLSVDGAGTVVVGGGPAAKIIAPLAVVPYIPTTAAPATISMKCQATNGQDISYLFDFGDGTPLLSSQTGWVTHQFTRNGEGKATQYLITAMCAQNLGDPQQVQTLRVNVRAPELTVLAGDSTRRIVNPLAVAVDAMGNLFVMSYGSDNGPSSDILKVSPDGRVSTLAGSAPGFADGTGAKAQFNKPRGIAVDAKGNVYVADTSNNALRKISATGMVTTWGKSWLPDGGAGASVSVRLFGYDPAVAVDGAGNVYVADAFNGAIRKISPAGVVSTVAEKLSFQPYGLAIDPMGNVLAIEGSGVALYKISPSGVVTKLSDFSDLRGIAIDPLGNTFATDEVTRSVYKINPDGVKSLFAGPGDGSRGLRDGQGTSALFGIPQGIALDSAGNLFVADSFNNAIRKISPAGEVTTVFPAGLSNGKGNLPSL